ncbi:MAG: hypothetical protein C5B51_10995 [Terriglobia bacterium]|nr:MAG: hypothetical protein C5B51_10995 [Terriglobia bacterium]
MNSLNRWKRDALLMAGAALLLAPVCLHGQFFPAGRGGPPRPPKEAAPIDLTGYWVSVVNEDWRFRMVVPPKGDYPGVPLTPEGRKVADAWDPAKDEASGNQCKSYGAAALMRVPSRFHITWQDDNTLKIESDAGTQTRLLHFGAAKAPAGQPTLQGYSAAEWQLAAGGRGGRGGQGQPGAAAQRGGSLRVVTTNLAPGYLRKNGVPYGAQTTVTEYFDLINEPDGEQWMIVKTTVEDPQYLAQPFVTSTNLKKQRDAAGWNPTPCTVK